VSPVAAQRLLSTAPLEPVRLDTRGLHGVPSLLWLNDLQADAPYKQWSPDLADAAKPGYRSLQFARLPLLTALFVLDPATTSGAALAAYAEQLCRRNAPLHIGLLATRADDAAAATLGGRAAGGAAAAAAAAVDGEAIDGEAAAAPAGVGGRLLQRVAAAGGRAALRATLRRLAKASAPSRVDKGAPPPSLPLLPSGLVPARLGVGALRAAHAEGVAVAAGGGKKKKKKGKVATTAGAAESAAAGEAAAADAFDALLLGGSDNGMEAQLEAGHAWAEERGPLQP